MELSREIDLLGQYINEAKRIVFFGGAGVSTESGVKDFRSEDGIYSMKFDYPPEEMLSHDFFFTHTEEFYRFYRGTLLKPGIRPNKAHYALARLEQTGKLTAIITQNIDGLHQKAGSKRVFELHGSVDRNRCIKCEKFYTYDELPADAVPRCGCGGLIKPEVVLYGEPLDNSVITDAVNEILHADTMIVAGSSLTVYPAAGLLRYFGGKRLILINRDATPYDNAADLVIRSLVGETLDKVIK